MRFRTQPIPPLDDPLGREPDTVWMSPEMTLFGWGEAVRFQPGPGSDRIDRIRRRFSDVIEQATVESDLDGEGPGPVVIASVSFAAETAGSVALIPEVVVGRRHDDWWMTSVNGAGLPRPSLDVPPHVDRARYAGSSVPDVLWLESAAEAVRQIKAGAIEKVVLARDYAVWSREPFHPPRLLRYLAGRFPRCHVFQVDGLIGASPELLVRRRGDRMESLVLAGSAPSFDDPGADRESGAQLLSSGKDRHEHELAVRSVTDALAPITTHLQAPGEPSLLRLDNIQHLATPVLATVSGGLDALALADSLHPTAAVGGTPTGAALELITRIEGMDRGRYAGPVGWMDGRGDGEFAIALRCAELSGARARLFAGAGIMAESLPEAELEETRIKLAAMMGALAAS